MARKANSGTRNLARYFDDRLKLPLFDSDKELEVGVLAIELRNLFTHNQGVVNRVFKERVPTFDCVLGQRINLMEGEPRLFAIHALALTDSAVSLHTKIVAKFDTVI